MNPVASAVAWPTPHGMLSIPGRNHFVDPCSAVPQVKRPSGSTAFVSHQWS